MHKALLPTLDCPPGLMIIWKGVNLCRLVYRSLGLIFSLNHEGLVFDGTGRQHAVMYAVMACVNLPCEVA